MRRAFVGVLLTGAVVPAAAQSKLPKPVIDTVNHHIVRVTSAGPTQWAGTTGWKLELAATVQPADGRPGELINPSLRGSSLIWDDAERVIVIDSKPAAIKRYDVTGKFIDQLGRDGDGPGEYRIPTITARGSRFVVHEQGTGTVKPWTNDRPGSLWRAEAFFSGYPTYLDTQDRFYNYTSIPDPKTGVLTVEAWLRWPASRWNGSSAPADTIRIPLYVRDGTPTAWKFAKGVAIKPFLNRNLSIIDRNGRMVWGDTKLSTFVVTANGRDTLAIYRLADTPTHMSVASRDSVIRAYADRIPAFHDEMLATAKASDLPEILPAWREITEDRLGNIWITRYASDGTVGRFDVIDASGRWLGSVAAPPRFGRAFAMGRDHVADIIEGDDGRPELRIFRINKGAK